MYENNNGNNNKSGTGLNNGGYQGIGKLEAITISVNYADFLDEMLYRNKHHFDTFVVVTTHADKATQGVCAKHNVICVQTDAMTERGDTINKGHGINLGLAYMRQTGWILHLDSDIFLPDDFRNMLDKSRLQDDCIYGADRVNIVGRDSFTKLQGSENYKRQFHHRYLLDVPHDAPLGARLIHNEYGYCPIGFFQLWNAKDHNRYPFNQGGAEHTDVLFALQWPINKRVLLPTVICYHVESEPAKMGTNWNGRKTKKF